MATPETSELSLPDTEEDFLSWLAVSSDWFPEATASLPTPEGSPGVPPTVAVNQGASRREEIAIAPVPLSRALSPLHAAALTASIPSTQQHHPGLEASPVSAAAHLRHAASGLSRMAASMWASLGMAHPAPAAPTLSSPELLATGAPGGAIPEALRLGVSVARDSAIDRPLFASVASLDESRPDVESARSGGGSERRQGHKRKRSDGGGSAARGAMPEALTLQDARRQIDALTTENTALRAQLRAVSTASTKDSAAQDRERQRQLSRIRALASAGDDPVEARQAVLRFKDLHSDFGKDRWVALRHHLTCLRSLLTPTLLTKVCTWGIEAQGAVDSGSGVEPGAVAGAAADVWTGLTEHARMNAEQRRRLLGLCEEARARRLDFEAAVRQLRLLEEAVTRNFTGLEGHMNRLMGAISPVQIALVLDWVDRHADVLASVAPLNAWPDVSGSLVPAAVGGAASSSDVGRRPSAAPVAARARPPNA